MFQKLCRIIKCAGLQDARLKGVYRTNINQNEPQPTWLEIETTLEDMRKENQ